SLIRIKAATAGPGDHAGGTRSKGRPAEPGYLGIGTNCIRLTVLACAAGFGVAGRLVRQFSLSRSSEKASSKVRQPRQNAMSLRFPVACRRRTSCSFEARHTVASECVLTS